MTSATTLAPELANEAFGYAHAVQRLIEQDMKPQEIMKDRRCRHVWFLIRGLSTHKVVRRDQHVTGPMLRDFAQRQLDNFLREGERRPRADIILGIIHQTGVLHEEENDEETTINFDEDHPLVHACLKYT